MKLTIEQINQIIREELEQILEGPKWSIAHKEKKQAHRANKAARDKEMQDAAKEVDPKDLVYKHEPEEVDLDDIHRKIADKFGGTFKKLKEEEKQKRWDVQKPYRGHAEPEDIERDAGEGMHNIDSLENAEKSAKKKQDIEYAIDAKKKKGVKVKRKALTKKQRQRKETEKDQLKLPFMESGV